MKALLHIICKLCYNNHMTVGGSSFSRKFRRWLDEWKLAASGILLASRDRKFLVTTLLTFVIFGTLMSLLTDGIASLDMLWVSDWNTKFSLLGESFLRLFGVNFAFWDWLLLFCITLLQSILIGLVVLVWQKRRRSKRDQIIATASNADNLQSAGLAAGLAVLGTGCPTCSTTLLTPVIATLFSTSSSLLAGVVSGVLTAISVLIALFALKRLGNDVYALITSEHYLAKKAKLEEKS